MLEILHRLDSPFGPTYTRAAPLQVQPERRLLPVGAWSQEKLIATSPFCACRAEGVETGLGLGWKWLVVGVRGASGRRYVDDNGN